MAARQQRTGDAAGQGLDLVRLEVPQEAGHQLRMAQVDHRRGEAVSGQGVEPEACRRRLAAASLDAAPGGAREGVKGAGQEIDGAAGAVPVEGGEAWIAIAQPAFDRAVQPRQEAAHHQAERFEGDRRELRPRVGRHQAGEAVQGGVAAGSGAAGAHRPQQDFGERHAQPGVQQDEAALGQPAGRRAVEQVPRLPGRPAPLDEVVAQALQEERRVPGIAPAGLGHQVGQLAVAARRPRLHPQPHQVVGGELGAEFAAAGTQLASEGAERRHGRGGPGAGARHAQAGGQRQRLVEPIRRPHYGREREKLSA